MMRFVLFGALIMLTIDSFSQCKEMQVDLNCLQGLWKKLEINEGSSKSYKVYNKTKLLTLYYDGNPRNTTFDIFRVGFINHEINQSDSLDVRELELKGKYYVVAKEPNKNTFKTSFYTCNGNDEYCDDESYEVGSLMYHRKSYFSKEIWNLIIKQGKIDNINYIKEFDLNIYNPIGKVLKEKSIIYREPNLPTNSYLIKGDEVEVLEERGEWLLVRYYGKKVVEGWVKKTDLE